MSAVIQNEYTGNNSTTTYSFTFPYLKTSDIKASLDGVDTTAFTLPNATTLQFNTAPGSGAKIKIFRQTSVDNLTATFYAGSAIKSEDLNDNFTQNLFKTQEVGERSLSTLGGTMTGNLTLDTQADLVFEGATADAHETTIKVVDPTADRTITFPNVTGTVVTTGDTGTVATGMIAGDAVTGAKIADDQINSEHYVDGSIDTAHIADAQVTTAKIADSNVTTVKLAADAVNGTKIADDSINSEHYVDGSIDTAHLADAQITAVKLQDGSVTSAKLGTDSVVEAKIVDGNVTAAKLASNSVQAAKIANDAVQTAKIADTAVTTAKIGNLQVTQAKIANNAVTNDKIADAELTTLAGMQSGTASKLADSTALTADIADLNQIDGLTKQTTISDSDASFPTSGAVVDYVTGQIDEIGGFEAIANEVSFPNTQPGAGVAISIADAAGIVVSASGSSTTGRTVGGSTVTINNIASNFNGTTVAAGIRFIVTSTGSGQVYNYHKATLAENDLVSLSGDINDFAERYRVGSSNPTSSLDNGDLFFNTSTGKMLVYNGTNTAWEEVQSIGNFFISTLSPAFDGSTQNFTLSDAPTNVQQILLIINGVVQKPNAGTSTPSEGFALDGSTVKLGAAPATGSTYHAVVMGSTVNIGTPSNNTVTTAILQNLSVSTGKIQDDAVTADKLANSINTEIATNTAKTTNATHTGEVTGGTTLTIANDVVDEANLKVSNSPTNGYFLSAQSGNTGGLTWANVDLTALSASNLTSGTIPDARFPATLPVADGSNLTGLASTVANGCIYENSKTISSNFSTSTTKNSMSAGPITIGAGVTLTIPSGSFYTIV